MNSIETLHTQKRKASPPPGGWQIASRWEDVHDQVVVAVRFPDKWKVGRVSEGAICFEGGGHLDLRPLRLDSLALRQPGRSTARGEGLRVVGVR